MTWKLTTTYGRSLTFSGDRGQAIAQAQPMLRPGELIERIENLESPSLDVILGPAGDKPSDSELRRWRRGH